MKKKTKVPKPLPDDVIEVVVPFEATASSTLFRKADLGPGFDASEIKVAKLAEPFVLSYFVLWYWKNPYGNYVQIVDIFESKVDASKRAAHLRTLPESSLVVVTERIE